MEIALTYEILFNLSLFSICIGSAILMITRNPILLFSLGINLIVAILLFFPYSNTKEFENNKELVCENNQRASKALGWEINGCYVLKDDIKLDLFSCQSIDKNKKE